MDMQKIQARAEAVLDRAAAAKQGRPPLWCLHGVGTCRVPLDDEVWLRSCRPMCKEHGERWWRRDLPATGTCRCGRTLYGGRDPKYCSDVCRKRAARIRKRRRVRRGRQCARQGCENTLTGRLDQRYCSGACRTAVSRQRISIRLR